MSARALPVERRGVRYCRNSNCGNHHQHIIVREETSTADEIVVNGTGRHTYVWLGKNGRCVAHVGGVGALRELHAALGRALLRVGEEKT